jgi:hypothetical protein
MILLVTALMRERVGSLWTLHSDGRPVVVETNIGWKKDGSNPMGAGMAKVAAEKYPELPGWYGRRCRRYGAETAVCYYETGNLFLFPTKPLNKDQPWMSWKNDASTELIRCSAIQLSVLVDILVSKKGMFMPTIGMPLIGCGNSNLDAQDVLPILRPKLDDRFVLFEKR